MSPDHTSMSSTSIKVVNLPKLKDNGSNWITYKERVLNTLTSKGLLRHITGTAKVPPEIEERDDKKLYLVGTSPELDEAALEAAYQKADEFAQKEACVRDIIYETISHSTFAQIKGEKTAALMWKKLMDMNEKKNEDVYGATLDRIMLMKCDDDANVRKHITAMTDLKEALAEMGNPLTDKMFSAYIRRSMPDSYKPLFTAINTASSLSDKPCTSDTLIQQIYMLADSNQALKDNEKTVEAAMSASAKSKPKGKGKGKSTSKLKCSNSSCGLTGHTIENCWRKGGKKEGEAPEWYTKKLKEEEAEKKKKAPAANVAATSAPDSDDDNIALMAHLDHPIPDNDDHDGPDALVVTSDFKHMTGALIATSGSIGIIIDCGASRHFSSDRKAFTNLVEITPSPIRAADGRTFYASAKGDMRISLPMGPDEKPTSLTLQNVYYSPNMAYTLISVSRMDRTGYIVHIEDGTCTISTPRPKSRVIGRIPRVDGLYRVSSTNSDSVSVAAVASKPISINQLHERMGHINHEDLRHMVKTGMVTGIVLDLTSVPEQCTVCIQAKAIRKPFPKKSVSDNIKEYGDKVVSDVWGPAPTESIGGRKYSICFEDLATREERIYYLKAKSESFLAYKKYEAWVRVQRNAAIKIFGCDRGGEFTSGEFTEYLALQGTVRHLTVHDSPQSNGVAERGNRTHLDLARAMLIASNLPESLWGEATRHAVWLRNRSLTRATTTHKTPYELATGRKPDLSPLRPFGSIIWVKRLNTRKLKPRAEQAIFVGIDDESKGCRAYWKAKRTVTIERDVYFQEKNVPGVDDLQNEGGQDDLIALFDPQPLELQKSSENNPNDVPDLNPVENLAENDPILAENLPQAPVVENIENPIPNIENEPGNEPAAQNDGPAAPAAPVPNAGRITRQRFPPGHYKALHEGKPLTNAALLSNSSQESLEPLDFALMTIDDEPRTVHEALSGGEAKEWLAAIENELAQIERFGTWEIIEAPSDANIIKSRYVFRRKRDATGKVVKHKARLVAKGYSQVHGTDYFETYAPVIKLATLRVLLALGARADSTIHQADVKNAYLHADIEEDVYMELPPHYTDFRQLSQHGKRLVCKLRKGLYGTKQAGRGWYQKLRRTFLELGYSVSTADEAVFFKIISPTDYVIVGAAVDDFTILADSEASAVKIQDQLNAAFEIVRLGELNWILGIHANRDRKNRTLALGQQSYIDQIISRFNLANSNPVITPMEPGIDLSIDSPGVSSTELTDSEKSRYREAIGFLMYTMLATRPDIAYAVSTLSQFMEAPRTTHWKAAQRVFQYLKGTRNLMLVLGGEGEVLTGFTDADWASQRHRHSISGYAFFIGSGAVSWSSKKQPIITLSSTESEYVALTHAAKEAIWLRKLLSELSADLHGPTTIFCDNQGAIALSKDSTFHAHTKHIDIHFHFIRQTNLSNTTRITYCPTNDMIADIFTKSLPRPKLEKFRSLLNLSFSPIPMRSD